MSKKLTATELFVIDNITDYFAMSEEANSIDEKIVLTIHDAANSVTQRRWWSKDLRVEVDKKPSGISVSHHVWKSIIAFGVWDLRLTYLSSNASLEPISGIFLRTGKISGKLTRSDFASRCNIELDDSIKMVRGYNMKDDEYYLVKEPFATPDELVLAYKDPSILHEMILNRLEKYAAYVPQITSALNHSK